MYSAGKACIHDSEILIGECNIENNIRLIGLNERDHFGNIIRIHLSGGHLCLCLSFKLFLKGITF